MQTTMPAQLKKPSASPLHADSGQSVLELAVCLPLFVLLVLGTAEIANIAWASVQVNNAAHAGAQFASLSHANAADTADIETAAKNEAPKLTITFPTAPSQSCVCTDPTTGNAATGDTCATCPSPNIPIDSVTVKTQAVVSPLVHYIGLPSSYTVQAQATMKVIQ